MIVGSGDIGHEARLAGRVRVVTAAVGGRPKRHFRVFTRSQFAPDICVRFGADTNGCLSVVCMCVFLFLFYSA